MDRIALMSMYVRIVETGSLSAVARELRMTQPTVSKRLEHLEKHLKVRLLARNTHGVRPTEAGQRYYEASKQLVADIGHLESTVASQRERVGGTLRLNFPVSSGQGPLMDIVCAFHEEHPEICVDMALTDRLVDLVEDAVDVAVRFNGIHDSAVIARPLGHLDAILIATPAYLKKHGTPKTPKDLEDHPFLRYDASNVEVLFGPNGQQAEVKADPWLRLDNSTALKRALLLGTGIGRMGRFLIHEELKRGELVQVLPGWGPALDTLYAVYLPTKFMPVKIKAFVAFLTEAVKTVPGWSPPS